ncbi:RNA polymerase sigma24 factor [Flexivirga endophytica]|uniref:RNA polymerase sigma24 factor n=1 Tax=Flexivirga endophytica TaxID=1849103 RepID=A0A916WRA0_9MICO|nr:RNA polymerase sigma24 factor [Flexivirga endophytica]GHB53784.1 RNA polymerase sigma24 factor [Flexivirga endophytica]
MRAVSHTAAGVSVQIEDVWRRQAPYVLAALLRGGRPLADCEDAAQEALIAALRQWTSGGIPRNPRGWLIRVAGRRLVDMTRTDTARARRELRDAYTSEQDRPTGWADRTTDRDDSLQLLVLCCHPSLSAPAAVALTLRAVAGLTTEQVAAGLLIPTTTAAQRISRAKKSLAGARFGPVAPAELPQRLHAVRHVLHLTFTAGSSAGAGPDLIDTGLTRNAIRLTDQLHRALPRDAETAGLLALMLLVDARTPARTEQAALVPLADQDRSRWHRDQIDRAVILLEDALPRGPVGPFQLQAAIAAVHATAATFADTDWAEILQLYRMLQDVAPSPAVDLGAAIALSEVDGARAGLAALEPLLRQRPRDHRIIAARAHLLEAIGDAEAAECYAQAAALTDSIPEQHYLHTKAAALRR